MKVNILKLHPDAIVPQYQTPGAACFDLHAINDGIVSHDAACVFGTGLALEIPEGYKINVYSRSGHGFKHGIRLANGTGIIDSDYRGELMVKLVSDGGLLAVKAGDRIAQAEIAKVDRAEFVEVASLPETERGAGGLGSTGA